jgi:hypothetical protein
LVANPKSFVDLCDVPGTVRDASACLPGTWPRGERIDESTTVLQKGDGHFWKKLKDTNVPAVKASSVARKPRMLRSNPGRDGQVAVQLLWTFTVGSFSFSRAECALSEFVEPPRPIVFQKP